MSEWNRYIQAIVDQIDYCIKTEDDENMTLSALSEKLGYSEYYTSRMFCHISGMTLKDYIRYRKLAFALKEVRDTEDRIINIAIKYGFSSNEAFTRAFRDAFSVTPSEYRRNPVPVVLRTIIKPFDCYLMEGAMKSMSKKESSEDVKVYFVRIPAHKFLHIRNYESTGYWDFWQKQAQIPGQMQLMDVPEGEYIVFEHGPFDYETEGQSVEAKIEAAMKEFDYDASGYKLDLTPERVFYFYHDCERFFKYVRPVIKK